MILDKENSFYAKCIQVFLITMIVVFEPEGLFGKMRKSVRLKFGHTRATNHSANTSWSIGYLVIGHP